MKSSLSPATQRLLDERTQGSLAAIFAEIAEDVPAAEWEKVPTGLARNPEQYLYGAQKTS